MRIGLVLSLLTLSGCATSSPLMADLTTRAVALREFTVEDLTAAQTYAQAHNDAAAVACYPAIIAKLQAHLAAQAVPVKGAVSAFEVFRVSVRGSGVRDDSLQLACAALKDQVLEDLAKVAIQVAGIVGSGGATGAPAAIDTTKKLLGLFKTLGLL